MALKYKVGKLELSSKCESKAQALTAHSVLRGIGHLKVSMVTLSPSEKWKGVFNYLIHQSRPEEAAKALYLESPYLTDAEVNWVEGLGHTELLSAWIHLKFLVSRDSSGDLISSFKQLFRYSSDISFSKNYEYSAQLDVIEPKFSGPTIFSDYFSGFPPQGKVDLVNDILDYLFVSKWSENSRVTLLQEIRTFSAVNNHPLDWAKTYDGEALSWLIGYLRKYHFMPTFGTDNLSHHGAAWLLAIFSYWGISEHEKVLISKKAQTAFKRKEKGSDGWKKQRLTVNLTKEACNYVYALSERSDKTYSEIIQGLVDKEIAKDR